MTQSDRGVSAETIKRCRQGDRTAYQALYEAYKDKVYSIALYFFHGDRSAASDVTQQVFLKIPPLGPLAPGELPVVGAPDSIWHSLDAALQAKKAPFAWWKWAAAFGLVVSAVLIWYVRSTTSGWEVVRLEGSPLIGKTRLAGSGRIAVGDWLQTDAASRARITLGEIGSVEIEPNSRVRLNVAKPNEHRLTLAKGEISAVVSAPPRLFFVETPASTAVDLGCAYRMKTDEAGSGLLQVTAGWVALEWKGRASLVPAGVSCRTRAGKGPGTPYFDDASAALQEALAWLDFEAPGAATIQRVLDEARLRDTLSLWHLLSRVDDGERPRVLNRMVELAPLPPGVSREKILELDKESLDRWRGELVWKW